ncbi:MaoC/PaaZ C-terminal domain-containing protein [Salinarimonas rosea]|uniref:MaoC/PaaZ C-terminal domain-containing protein n=1 Tax=Salinarimonas rosea TaxID=552063 RepID=UPI00041849FD|nr:MaoC/PaaZ C-terminal domain-containing protein [Salinarimonas rosea]
MSGSGPTHAEDYTQGAVFALGSVVVGAGEIVDFARRFDPQPYHVSAEAGAASFFGGLVASGFHTTAIWMGLYVRALLDGAAVEGSPGLENVRWHAPVRPGDTLEGRCEVGEIVPSPFRRDIVTIKKKGSLSRPGEAKPVMTLVLLSRFRRRDAIGG